jgi:hypothetical protein
VRGLLNFFLFSSLPLNNEKKKKFQKKNKNKTKKGVRPIFFCFISFFLSCAQITPTKKEKEIEEGEEETKKGIFFCFRSTKDK